jgi:hypothetical protein
MPNHAKKQRKNAIHDMWNARICGVENENSAMRVALLLTSMADLCLSIYVRPIGAVRRGLGMAIEACMFATAVPYGDIASVSSDNRSLW